MFFRNEVSWHLYDFIVPGTLLYWVIASYRLGFCTGDQDIFFVTQYHYMINTTGRVKSSIDCAGRLLFGNEDESRFYRTKIMRRRKMLSQEHLEINDWLRGRFFEDLDCAGRYFLVTDPTLILLDVSLVSIRKTLVHKKTLTILTNVRVL